MWLSPALFRFLNALIALNSVHPIFILFRQKEKCWKWQYQPRNVHFPFELQVTTSICACINNENKWRKKTHRKEINLLLIFVHTKTCLLDSQIICFCLLHFTFDFFSSFSVAVAAFVVLLFRYTFLPVFFSSKNKKKTLGTLWSTMCVGCNSFLLFSLCLCGHRECVCVYVPFKDVDLAKRYGRKVHFGYETDKRKYDEFIRHQKN